MMGVYVQPNSAIQAAPPPVNYSAVALDALVAILNSPKSSTLDRLEAAKAMLEYLKL